MSRMSFNKDLLNICKRTLPPFALNKEDEENGDGIFSTKRSTREGTKDD